MEWYFQALISLVMLLAGWLIGRPRQKAETAGIRIDNEVKSYNYANDLFNKVVELRQEVDELLENNKLLNYKLNEEIKIRINCEERLTAVEDKIK